MSGVWYEGDWYDHTGLVCRRCGHPVFESNLKEQGYKFQCFHCDEDMFSFEVEAETAPPQIVVARPVDGVAINTAVEYLCDENGMMIIFANRPAAEAYLLEQGHSADDFVGLHFIVHDGVPAEGPPEQEQDKLAAALESGEITMADISEELDYRERSHQKWNDSLYEYSDEELARIEESHGD